MIFSKSFNGRKLSITMRPVLIESTLLCLLIKKFPEHKIEKLFIMIYLTLVQFR